MQEADHALYYFNAKRSLTKWHAKFLRLRKEKRQHLLDSCLNQNRSKLTKQCFTWWRQKSTEIRNLQDMAEEIRHERDLDILGGSFQHWHERTMSVEMLEIRATDHHKSRLLRYLS
jgi:protein SFI1